MFNLSILRLAACNSHCDGTVHFYLSNQKGNLSHVCKINRFNGSSECTHVLIMPLQEPKTILIVTLSSAIEQDFNIFPLSL